MRLLTILLYIVSTLSFFWICTIFVTPSLLRSYVANITDGKVTLGIVKLSPTLDVSINRIVWSDFKSSDLVIGGFNASWSLKNFTPQILFSASHVVHEDRSKYINPILNVTAVRSDQKLSIQFFGNIDEVALGDYALRDVKFSSKANSALTEFYENEISSLVLDNGTKFSVLASSFVILPVSQRNVDGSELIFEQNEGQISFDDLSVFIQIPDSSQSEVDNDKTIGVLKNFPVNLAEMKGFAKSAVTIAAHTKLKKELSELKLNIHSAVLSFSPSRHRSGSANLDISNNLDNFTFSASGVLLQTKLLSLIDAEKMVLDTNLIPDTTTDGLKWHSELSLLSEQNRNLKWNFDLIPKTKEQSSKNCDLTNCSLSHLGFQSTLIVDDEFLEWSAECYSANCSGDVVEHRLYTSNTERLFANLYEAKIIDNTLLLALFSVIANGDFNGESHDLTIRTQ